jgi:hypothetical protein
MNSVSELWRIKKTYLPDGFIKNYTQMGWLLYSYHIFRQRGASCRQFHNLVLIASRFELLLSASIFFHIEGPINGEPAATVIAYALSTRL